MRLMTRGFLAVLSLLCALALGLALEQDGAPSSNEKIMNPANLTERAPDNFQARFETTRGTFVVQVRRAWTPNGADRFYNLVKNGYYDNCRFFRVMYGALVQFGINGDPKVNAAWMQARIPDDPVKQSNRRGYVSFATGGKNGRTAQILISLSDENIQLDAQGIAPFGTIVKGTDIVNAFYAEYDPPMGKRGPEESRLQIEGNAYLDKSFPKLDYIKSATIVSDAKK